MRVTVSSLLLLLAAQLLSVNALPVEDAKRAAEPEPDPANYGDYGNYGKYGDYGAYAPPPPPNENPYGSYASYGTYKREAETEE
jgi:hypothetical protein